MHAEAGLQPPAAFSQGFFFQDYNTHYYSHLPLLDDDLISRFHFGITDGGPNLVNMVQTTPTVSEYDMGGEGDLFKAPEPILEDPALDPVAAAMSIISGDGDVITAETIKAADIESIQNDHLSDIYYECKKDLLGKSEIEDSISQLLDEKFPNPIGQMDEVPALEKLSSTERSMQKSVSSGCLSSVEWVPNSTMSTMRPDFLDFQGLDFEAALGLRRAFSEGDIQNLGNKNISTGNTTTVCSSFEKLLTISDIKTKQRQQKLSRYREKKSKRNFGRKIKYACRKALADSQRRVRGRFAKSEEPNMSFQMLN
ncbi:hypothetical protein Cni_G19829 [Canna indica]|uniref:CCT domain-containing protein n=1 Tax=Canna indica TaxID=4628 RepID=A0AAQ3QIZ7_9LILI|nr:hypothetical protein Cni_G19829 [Canna indica]